MYWSFLETLFYKIQILFVCFPIEADMPQIERGQYQLVFCIIYPTCGGKPDIVDKRGRFQSPSPLVILNE